MVTDEPPVAALAAQSGKPEVLDVLLKAGAAWRKTGYHEAGLLKYARGQRMTERILALGADVNQKDEYRWTPLIHAASDGDAAKVMCLLRHGADPSHKADNSVTALSMARETKHSQIVSLLLGALRRTTARSSTKASLSAPPQSSGRISAEGEP